MTITPKDLVRREVHYCVSGLVSTLASGAGSANIHLGGLFEQALDLVAPTDDFEEAARDAGWEVVDGEEYRDGHHIPGGFRGWEALCRDEGIEPFEREVYEHWIVSDWLADKLAERGEKVDKDFAGLTVWARTTTGQAIYMDAVIEEIVAALHTPEAGQ